MDNKTSFAPRYFKALYEHLRETKPSSKLLVSIDFDVEDVEPKLYQGIVNIPIYMPVTIDADYLEFETLSAMESVTVKAPWSAVITIYPGDTQLSTMPLITHDPWNISDMAVTSRMPAKPWVSPISGKPITKPKLRVLE